MKVLKLMLIILILAGLMVPTFGCGSESSEVEGMEYQVAEVQRGDLIIDITAAGNLALSRTEDLAIDLFYEEGTVEEVLVEEGDTVKEGQVLAKLDTEEWEDELSTLEDQVTAKERDLLQAKINLQTAEQNLKNAQDNKAAKQLALFNAQIDLDQAKLNLEQTQDLYTWSDFKAAQADVDEAEEYLEYCFEKLIKYVPKTEKGDYPKILEYVLDEDYPKLPGYKVWQERIVYAQSRLNTAEDRLDAMLSGSDIKEVAIKKLQIEAAEMALAQAEEDLDKVAKDVALKELQLTLSQGRLVDAQKALIDAQEELDDAKSKSPLIVAPFAGFITMVNVEGGDEVLTGTVAVQLADPNKFEADILVSEMDILQVNLGAEAWVEADAMLGIKLPAEITDISPTATIEAGVVNYLVKVEIESPQALMQKQQEERQKLMEEISSGKLPEHLRQAIESGQITQEQAEDMMKQMQQGQIPTIIPEDFQLKEGLTVTVNILIDERTNVLLIPSNAIERRGMATYVQVMKDGIVEERAINTGISNWQYTEVTDGLNEGEQVVLPNKTTTTAPATPQSRGPLPFMRH